MRGLPVPVIHNGTQAGSCHVWSVQVSRKSWPLLEGMQRPSPRQVSASEVAMFAVRQHMLWPPVLHGACWPEASAEPLGKKQVADALRTR